MSIYEDISTIVNGKKQRKGKLLVNQRGGNSGRTTARAVDIERDGPLALLVNILTKTGPWYQRYLIRSKGLKSSKGLIHHGMHVSNTLFHFIVFLILHLQSSSMFTAIVLKSVA